MYATSTRSGLGEANTGKKLKTLPISLRTGGREDKRVKINKNQTYLTITTPSTFSLPLPNLSSTSSGTFLFIPLKYLAQECDSITGASVRSNAWRAVWSDTWERSMKMPSRFISGMSSLPRGLVYCGEKKKRKRKKAKSKKQKAKVTT